MPLFDLYEKFKCVYTHEIKLICVISAILVCYSVT